MVRELEYANRDHVRRQARVDHRVPDGPAADQAGSLPQEKCRRLTAEGFCSHVLFRLQFLISATRRNPAAGVSRADQPTHTRGAGPSPAPAQRLRSSVVNSVLYLSYTLPLPRCAVLVVS